MTKPGDSVKAVGNSLAWHAFCVVHLVSRQNCAQKLVKTVELKLETDRIWTEKYLRGVDLVEQDTMWRGFHQAKWLIRHATNLASLYRVKGIEVNIWRDTQITTATNVAKSGEMSVTCWTINMTIETLTCGYISSAERKQLVSIKSIAQLRKQVARSKLFRRLLLFVHVEWQPEAPKKRTASFWLSTWLGTTRGRGYCKYLYLPLPQTPQSSCVLFSSLSLCFFFILTNAYQCISIHQV